MIISRYMFEKFGTLPEQVVEMDDYQKGVIFSYLEDIVNVRNENMKKQERAARLSRRRRR